MTLLFDLPEPPPDRKPARARKKVAPPPAEKQEAEKRHSYIGQTPARAAIKAIGRLDHTHECADERCRGSAHDILTEDRGEWLIQCCFCNTCQWVPVIEGHLEPRREEFFFRDGRFEGLTIDEAAAQPHGLDYIRWAAEKHKRPAVQSACKTWLDSQNAAR